MANWVLSIRRLRSAALSVDLCVISPGARSGKSLSGSVCNVKRERPARIASAARSPEDSRTIWAPSGSLRTMSKNMWAGTVVDPPGPTSAAIVSVTSTSRSVAFRLSFERSARSSTLARIGMVLRRSTTRWTWPSDFNNSERSTVIFIAKSVHAPVDGRMTKVTLRTALCKADPSPTRSFPSLSPFSWGLPSVLELAFEPLNLFGEGGVVAGQRLDLAHGVQHGGVVAAAEPAPDLGQRAQRQDFRQIHRHLPRPHHVGGAPGRQKIGAADIVLAGDDALDVLDPHPLRLLRADQVAHLALGHFKGYRLTGELVVGEQPIDCAFQVAAVMGHRLGDIDKHGRRHFEAGMIEASSCGPALEDFEPQFFAERTDLHHQPAGEPGADAVVEALQVRRRPVAGDHDLPAGVDERIERVAELGLGRAALQELQVVDHQHVDGAHGFLERQRRLGLQRRDKAVHEALCGQVEHFAVGAVAGPGDRLQEVGFA